MLVDPDVWLGLVEGWYRQMPLASPEAQQQLWADGLKLWQGVLDQYSGTETSAAPPKLPRPELPRPELPRKDKRFADPRWREQPVFALIHQTYTKLQ